MDKPAGDAAAAFEAMLALDHALLRLPFEQLTKVFRNAQKIVERELQAVLASVANLSKAPIADAAAACEAAATLKQLLARAQHLQRRLVDINNEEAQCLERLDRRLAHLERMAQVDVTGPPEVKRHFHRVRFERILVDYLLREGFYESALTLASDSQLHDLVDVDLFLACRKVEESLRRRSCTECLQWCAENRAKLRKTKSDLEFQLRQQEFIELVRTDQLAAAIQYVRKHLVPFMDTHAAAIQRAMALLAFPESSTSCARYQKLYAPERWDQLIAQFRNDNFALYSLSAQSLLSVTLQAGLSALKMPQCNQEGDRNVHCPVCDPVMYELAKDLPRAQHTHSVIVCRETGAVLDADNPPYMLPNGHVYSMAAVTQGAAGPGRVMDPRTKETFDASEVRKVFIM